MWFTLILGWIIFSIFAYLWHYFIEIILDLPPVSKINTSDDYDHISIAELGLRDVIRRVAREASRLPWLGNGDLHQRSIGNTGSVRQPPDSTYEDLLATAILNKVIESYQQKDVQNHSEPGSFSSHRTSRSNSIRTNPLDDLSLESFTRGENTYQHRDVFNRPIHVNPLLDDERFSEHSEHHSIDEGYAGQSGSSHNKYRSKQVDEEGGSLSSLEDYSGESCSSKPRNGLSLTIKQSIEEMTSSDMDSCDPQIESSDYSEINTSLKRKNICDRCSLVTDDDIDLKQPELWEENWLFQKKKTKSNIISTPVAMLVPKSSTEYRALIGDRDAEDTTDLSDVGSDYEENDETSSKNDDFKSILVTSKTIIGGKNDFGFVEEVIDDDTVNLSIELTTKLPNSNDEELYAVLEKNESKEDIMIKPQSEIEKCIITDSKTDTEIESIPKLLYKNELEDDKINSENKEKSLINKNEEKISDSEFKFNGNDDLLPDPQKECNITKQPELEIVTNTLKEFKERPNVNNNDKIESQFDNIQNNKISSEIDSKKNENELDVSNKYKNNRDSPENVEEYEAFTVDTTLKGVKTRAQKWDTFIEKKSDENVNQVNVIKLPIKDYFQKDNDAEKNENIINEAKNSTLLNDENNSEYNSVEANIQKDNEYSEQYNTIGRKEIEYPTAAPRSYLNKKDIELDINDIPPQKGTIAEREHLKWQNAVPMPNNPYTAENIEKRLSQRSRPSSLLPNITTLERRNSYKRDIDLSENNNCDDNDIEVSFKIISVEELSNSGTNHSSEFSNSSLGVDKDCYDVNNLITIPANNKINQDLISKNDLCLNDDKSRNNNICVQHTASNENIELIDTSENNTNENKYDENNTDVIRRDYCCSESKLSRPNSVLSECTTPAGSSLQDVFGNDDVNPNKRFGRDYYVREAKQASGARKRFSELNQDFSSSYQSDGEDNLEISIEERNLNSNDNLTYKATPVKIVEDTQNLPQSENFNLNTNQEVGELLSMVSSSDSCETSNSLDVQRVYNLDSGKIVYKTSDTQKDKKIETVPIKNQEQRIIEKFLDNFNNSDDVNTFKPQIQELKSCEIQNSKPQIEATPFKYEVDEMSSNNYSNEIDLISFNSTPDNEITIIEKGSPSFSNSCSSINNVGNYETNLKTANKNDEVGLTVEQRKKKILSLFKTDDQKLDLNENRIKPVHSLTARSLSKQFRLQNSQSSPQLNQLPIEQHRLRTYTPDVNESPKLSLKQKKEFYESLSRK